MIINYDPGDEADDGGASGAEGDGAGSPTDTGPYGDGLDSDPGDGNDE